MATKNTKTAAIKAEIAEQATTGDLEDPKTKMALLLDGDVTVMEYKGEKYRVSRTAMDDLELVEMLEDEKYISAVRKILGPKQWAAFKEAARADDGRIPMVELEGLLKAVMGHSDPQDAS